jgi:glucokinase
MSLTIGVDLGGTNTRAGLVTESGEVVGRARRPTRLDLGADGIVEGIAECAREAAKDGGVSLTDVQGVGVGAPGPLDPFEGVMISPENLQCMHGVRLKDQLEALLGLSVSVDNDANLAAFGEQWLGAGRGVEHFLCVTLGTGVGGGWVSDGRVMHGFNGNAAEVGHITVNHAGPRCLCCNYGCLEMYASATAMVRRTREKLEAESPDTSLNAEGLTTQTIFEAAEAGDAFGVQMFEETGFFLGVGLVSLVNVLNVDRIALAGGLAQAGDRIFEPAIRTFMDRGTVGVKEHVEIVAAELGDDAGLLGAARYVRESL